MLQVDQCFARLRIESRLDQLGNCQERQAALQKRRNCDFVRRIQNGRCGATGLQRAIREAQATESVEIGGFEIQPRQREQVQRCNARLDTSGPRQRVRQRSAHIGIAELREHRAVVIFDQRMNDALRMHDDVDLRRTRAEQPVRLDHFEALVHERGRIYRNLAAHAPVWMCTRLVRRDRRQFVAFFAAERAAGRGEQDTPHAGAGKIGASARQALKNRVVFGIHGQQITAADV